MTEIEEEGTYVIALESMISQKEGKYTLDQNSLKKIKPDMNIFIDPCLHINYTYYINKIDLSGEESEMIEDSQA